MIGNRANPRSRMANYHSSHNDEADNEHNNRNQDNSNHSNEEKPDNLDMVFDLNDMLHHSENSVEKQERPMKVPLVYDTSDPFAEVEYDENAPRQDNSGFFEQEEIVIETKDEEPEPEFEFKPSTFTSTTSKAYRQEDSEQVFIPALDLPSEERPMIETVITNTSTSSYTQVPTTTSNSYTNYQISSAARAGNKRKQMSAAQKTANRAAVTHKKPDILAMDDGDIGEVGEWIGKSANINAKNKDDDDDDEDEEQNNDEDDFDGVFDQPNDAMLKAKAKAMASVKKAAIKGKEKISKQVDDDDEEGEKEAEFEAVQDNLNTISNQSNLAMQKAQTAILKNSRNKGPFANSLKEKAKTIQTKAQEGLVDGEIKLKGVQQKALAAFDENANEEEEDDEKATKKVGVGKGSSSNTLIAAEIKPKVDDKSSPTSISSEKGSQNSSPQKSQNTTVSQAKEPSQRKKELSISNQNTSPVELQEDEWDTISKQNLIQINQKGPDTAPTLIEFSEAWEQCKKLPLTEQKQKVEQELQGSQSIMQKLFSCTKANLPPPLLEERNQILALAKVEFDNDNALHFDMLQTVYNKLTGKKTQAPRFGTHWEVIGFQGTDPATDLRGVGILGLLQLLAFTTNHWKLFKKMFEHSTDKQYNFPLSICGFSMTLAAMETLRAGKMNGAIIANKSVIKAFNDYYFATFYKLYSVYEQNKYTILEYPIAKTTAVDALKANPAKILLEFKKDCIKYDQ